MDDERCVHGGGEGGRGKIDAAHRSAQQVQRSRQSLFNSYMTNHHITSDSPSYSQGTLRQTRYIQRAEPVPHYILQYLGRVN